MPTPTIDCILPHVSEPKALLLREIDGWRLHEIRLEESWFWFPYGVGKIAQRVNEVLNVCVTVLRHLRADGERHLCELENHDAGWTPPGEARWVSREDLDALPLAQEEQRTALLTWFAEQQDAPLAPERKPWERCGWFAEASDWIREQLQQNGFVPTGPVEQFKAAWDWSSLLKVPTDQGDLYFKADYAKPPSEVVIIRKLAQRWPQNVPSLVAADEGRRWMLMRDFGSRYLHTLPVESWEEAVHLYARIQMSTAQAADEWLALGCPDYRTLALPATVAAILDDDGFFAVMLPEFSHSSRQQIRERLPLLIDRCSELAVTAISDTLTQQDFYQANFVATEDSSFLFFDWSNAGFSHPFFSLMWMLNYLPEKEEADRQKRVRIRDAYLHSWAGLASLEELERIFALVQQINPWYQAVRGYRELPFVDRTKPWGKQMVRWTTSQLENILKIMCDGIEIPR